jgi:hypothetical protein
VPPRCFFPTPAPNAARITVPCCESCRRKGESNEQVVRNLFISTVQAESHPIVSGQLGGKRDRSFAYDRQQAERLISLMRPASVHSSSGQFIGVAPAFDLNNPLVDEFLLRIVRALLHEEKECGFVDCTVAWRLNPPAAECREFASEAKGRRVGDTFAYATMIPDGSVSSLWLLEFYERLYFFVHLKPAGEASGRTKPA